MTDLARAITSARGSNSQTAPVGGHFAEVDEVWTQHVAVVTQLRTFLESEAETKKDIAVARTAESLAHDIKNPLIAFDFALRAQSWEEFARLRAQMTRSLTTIRTILAGFGKSGELHIIKPTPVQLEMATLTDDLSQIYGTGETSITLKGQPTIAAFVDAIAVERAISNLVKNAVEAGANRVEIACLDDGANITLSVSDDGPGVPASLLDRLFKRGSTQGKADGSGIGLHNVRAIAEGHGGSVQYSREEGRSVFTIFLPNAVATRMDAQASTFGLAVSISAYESEITRLPKSIFIGVTDEPRKAELSTLMAQAGFTLSDSRAASIALVAEDDDNLTLINLAACE